MRKANAQLEPLPVAKFFIPGPKVKPANLRYFDLVKNWSSQIKPCLGDVELNRVMRMNFRDYKLGIWGKRFADHEFPCDIDSWDWRLSHRGPHSRYWRYVCQGACHWIVNFTLRLAFLVFPNRPWRILTSPLHSTVWDGDKTLFDFNFQALGLSPAECFKDAHEYRLETMHYLPVGPPSDFAESQKRRKKRLSRPARCQRGAIAA